MISSNATESRRAFRIPVPGMVFPSQLCPSVERNREQVKQVQAQFRQPWRKQGTKPNAGTALRLFRPPE